MEAAFRRYRLMSFVTGTTLLVLVVFLILHSVDLSLWTSMKPLVTVVGIGHGVVLYPIYLVMCFQFTLKARLPFGLLVLMLLSGFVPGLGAGTRYRFRLDGKESYPDPRSDYQPEGPHGPSEVVDRAAFEWTDGGWSGLSADGLVVYELHVGTYTPEGTFSLSAWSLLGGSAVVLGRTRREK